MSPSITIYPPLPSSTSPPRSVWSSPWGWPCLFGCVFFAKSLHKMSCFFQYVSFSSTALLVTIPGSLFPSTHQPLSDYVLSLQSVLWKNCNHILLITTCRNCRRFRSLQQDAPVHTCRFFCSRPGTNSRISQYCSCRRSSSVLFLLHFCILKKFEFNFPTVDVKVI